MPERRRHAVRWSPEALRDVERIAAFLVASAPLRAGPIVERIIAHADSLAASPRRGRAIPELRGLVDRSWREILEPPWRVVYQIRPDRVVMIHAILDGRRDLQDLLMERILRAEAW